MEVEKEVEEEEEKEEEREEEVGYSNVLTLLFLPHPWLAVCQVSGHHWSDVGGAGQAYCDGADTTHRCADPLTRAWSPDGDSW